MRRKIWRNVVGIVFLPLLRHAWLWWLSRPPFNSRSQALGGERGKSQGQQQVVSGALAGVLLGLGYLRDSSRQYLGTEAFVVSSSVTETKNSRLLRSPSSPAIPGSVLCCQLPSWEGTRACSLCLH